jgi:hypothetical protein
MRERAGVRARASLATLTFILSLQRRARKSNFGLARKIDIGKRKTINDPF